MTSPLTHRFGPADLKQLVKPQMWALKSLLLTDILLLIQFSGVIRKPQFNNDGNLTLTNALLTIVWACFVPAVTRAKS